MGNQIPTFQGIVVSLSSRVKVFNILQVIESHRNMMNVSATHIYHELMELAQDRERWQALVSMVMNLWVP